jgi:hypothetical protein
MFFKIGLCKFQLRRQEVLLAIHRNERKMRRMAQMVEEVLDGSVGAKNSYSVKLETVRYCDGIDLPLAQTS